MNVKKTLAILEILCPMFRNAEGKNGTVNYNTPEGHLLFLPEQVKLIFRSIWCPDNEVLNATEKMIRFIINMIFTLALTPIMFIIWIISQLIFAMHYDHKQREHGRKSYLMIMYSVILILLFGLIIMTVDYTKNHNSQYMDLTSKVFSSINPESKPKRDIIRTYNENDNILVVAESEHKQTSVSDGCNDSTDVESITSAAIDELETEQVSESPSEDESGYILKRKNRY